MTEKIEIIYAFNGFADPKIKNVEVSRLNGYGTKIIKGSEEKMIYKLKNLTEADVGKIIELADQKDIDIEDILSFLEKFIKKGKGGKTEMTDLTNDEKRFTAEEIIVKKYQESHPGISYRDAVVASLNRTESVVKREFTEEEKKQREKGVKNKMVMTNKERQEKVQKYMTDHEGVTYSQAVKICLDRTENPGEAIPEEEEEKEEFKEEGLTRSEVQMSKQKLESVIFELSILKKLDAFSDEDKDKLKEAYETCKVVSSNTEPIFSRNL